MLALNEPTEELLQALHRGVSGVTTVVSGVNRGFAGACNMGARAARGDYIVLLNDDTEVEPGWLEALVETADGHPDAGAIGSKVLNPDGSLQEVGALVWNDGTAAAVGGLVLPADLSVLEQLRRVDYCGAEALLVRRQTWDAVGGFSDDYYPAYYEDVDLCFKIAELGQDVLIQPAARLRHARGNASSRRYQHFVGKRSRGIFVERWAARLTEYHPPLLSDPYEVQKAICRAAEHGAGRAEARGSDGDPQFICARIPGDEALSDLDWLRREAHIKAEFQEELEATLDELLLALANVRDLVAQREGAEAAALEKVRSLEVELDVVRSDLAKLQERSLYRLADKLETWMQRAPLLHRAGQRLTRKLARTEAPRLRRSPRP